MSEPDYEVTINTAPDGAVTPQKTLGSINEMWPDKCPECNRRAWIGATNVSCTYPPCKHSTEEENAKYLVLLREYLTMACSEFTNTLFPWEEE